MNPVDKLIKLELDKCKFDPIYFINNYIIRRDPIKGRSKFKLRPYQKDIIKILETGGNPIITKARQIGVTSLYAYYFLWKTLFKTDVSALAIVTKHMCGVNFIDKIKYAYDNLPHWILSKLKIHLYNKSTLIFNNGNGIYFHSANDTPLCSIPITDCFIDEATFMNGLNSIIHSITPIITYRENKGSFSIVSTARNKSDLFYAYVKNAIHFGDYISLTLDYKVAFDDRWLAEHSRHMSSDEIKCEYFAEFLDQ